MAVTARLVKFRFQQETFADSIDEAKPLLEEHWKELARNQALIDLDPDYEIYVRVEQAGMLRVYTVRLDGDLVGYAVYFVRPHLHYRKHVWATSDVIWVRPEARTGWVGVQFIQYIENALAADGVVVMHTTGKMAHPALLKVLERAGHEHIEFGCSKLLRKAH